MNVTLVNEDRVNPWVLQGAALVGKSGETLEAQWAEPNQPLSPGESRQVWLEVVVPGAKAQAPYELVLWDENKARTVTVRGVKLP